MLDTRTLLGYVFATLEIGIIFEEYIMLIRLWTGLVSLIRDDQRKAFTVPFDRFIRFHLVDKGCGC